MPRVVTSLPVPISVMGCGVLKEFELTIELAL